MNLGIEAPIEKWRFIVIIGIITIIIIIIIATMTIITMFLFMQ